MGIRQKPELDIAVAEYKKYWWTVYLAPPEGKNKPYSCNKLCIKAEESIEITRFEP